jgi:hypothetical protein
MVYNSARTCCSIHPKPIRHVSSRPEEQRIMFSIHRLFPFAVSSALAAILWAPAPASARMNSRHMQSMRPVGMMGMPSLGRVGLMMGGIRNFSPMMNGTGGIPMRSPGMTMGQGGSAAMSAGYGGYGAGSARMTSQPSPYGTGAGYDTAKPDLASAPRSPGQAQLAALRGQARGLSWPVALRYLTRDGTWKETREQIDARVDELLTSKGSVSGSAAQVSEIRQGVAKVRQHFDRQGDDLPVTRQQEADARRFLNQVRDALQSFP